MELWKSSFGDVNGGARVEVAGSLAVLRDSKNPGDLLVVDLQALLVAVKSDRLRS
jgi:hypothetical protein